VRLAAGATEGCVPDGATETLSTRRYPHPPSGGDPSAQLNRVFYRQISVLGSTMGTRAELERLMALVHASGLRPLIDRTYPLAEARAALSRMAAGEQQGKIVLVP